VGNWKSRTPGLRCSAVTVRITVFWDVTPCSLPPSSGSTFFRTFVDLYQTAQRNIPKDRNRERRGYTSREEVEWSYTKEIRKLILLRLLISLQSTLLTVLTRFLNIKRLCILYTRFICLIWFLEINSDYFLTSVNQFIFVHEPRRVFCATVNRFALYIVNNLIACDLITNGGTPVAS
jgi:hypothetical protein